MLPIVNPACGGRGGREDTTVMSSSRLPSVFRKPSRSDPAKTNPLTDFRWVCIYTT